MNEWVKKSIEFAYSPGYLDKLTEIYPAIPSVRELLPVSVKAEIAKLIENKNYASLIRLLIGLKGHPFPIEHPYISVMRKIPKLIDQNPLVVEQIGRILSSIGDIDVIKGCERPPDLNRQMGPIFQNWLKRYFRSRGFAFVPAGNFLTCKSKCFLDAGDTAISSYANTNLGCELTRGRDFLCKIGNKFILAEARFLSSVGGSQNRDVRETVGFAKDRIGNVIKVAVIDGMVWFDKNMLTVMETLKEDEPGLSALLLEDFLNSLG